MRVTKTTRTISAIAELLLLYVGTGHRRSARAVETVNTVDDLEQFQDELPQSFSIVLRLVRGICNNFSDSSIVLLTIIRLHRMHEMQTTVTDDRGVCP